MKVRIEKIVYPGKSLAYYNNKVVFLDEGLPQEEVEIKILKEKKNFSEAQVLKIISKSAYRKNPLCKHFKICSKFQYIEYTQQLKIKEFFLKETSQRIFKRELNASKILASPLEFRYRNKGIFSVIYEKNTPFLAYHIPNTFKEFIKIDECYLFSERANKILKETLNKTQIYNLKSIKNIEVRESFSQKNILINIYLKDKKEFDAINKLNINAENVLLSLTHPKLNPPQILEYKVLKGKDFIEEKILNFYFRVSISSFFQINTFLLTELLSDIIKYSELTGKEKIADFYCGVGALSIPISKKAYKIFGIESEYSAIRDLKYNLIKNSVYNYTIAEGKVEDFCDYILNKGIDLLILDPPRTGLTNKVLKSILKFLPKRIFYIACDLATLSRDLKVLDSHYKIKDIFLYDFFAQTPYVESFVILERKV